MEVDLEHESQHGSQHGSQDGSQDGSQHGDSETEVSPSENHTGSLAWNYFTKDTNYKQNKKATCNICSKTYVCSGGSTSNLTSHLQRVHKITKSQQGGIDIREAFKGLKAKKVNI